MDMTDEKLQEMRDAAFKRLDAWDGPMFVAANPPDRFSTWASSIVADAICEAVGYDDDEVLEWFDELVEKANEGCTVSISMFRHDRCEFIQDICKAYYEART